jgi:fimbrial chaperone protein
MLPLHRRLLAVHGTVTARCHGDGAMHSVFLRLVLAILAMAAFTAAAQASGLRVEPVLLELNAPAAASMLTLRNDEDFDVAVQTRVFRWSQAGTTESLDPATDVVASPPITTLAPGSAYTVRVVRTAKTPVRGEESYRVLVDELPDARRLRTGGISILLRQSIPVFFRAPALTPADVAWSLHARDGKLLIVGTNRGDERLRIASLRLRDRAGRTTGFGNGLVGYVLGRSSMTFTIAHPPQGFGASGPVSIAAESNTGPVQATAALQRDP